LVLAIATAACSSSSSSPPPPAGDTPPGETPTSGDGTTPPPDGTTPPPATPPGETEWTPPTVATTSAACGTAKADANGVDYTTPSGRTFHVYGPSGYDKNKTYPVLLMFHGWQSEGPDFQSWFQMEQYVSNEAFVVYLDAVNGYWDINGDSDLKFVDEVIKQLGDTYCINPSNILAFGFSWGGFFAHHVGCNRAGYVKAVVAGESGFGGNTTGCGRLPVFITNRTADTNEPVSHGQSAMSTWTKLDACTDDVSAPDANNCTVHTSCKNPGGTVTFCIDTSSMSDIPGYTPDWDHTVRENYRTLAYQWFKALP
jgi:polyhydroxybutyrate depolymerase